MAYGPGSPFRYRRCGSPISSNGTSRFRPHRSQRRRWKMNPPPSWMLEVCPHELHVARYSCPMRAAPPATRSEVTSEEASSLLRALLGAPGLILQRDGGHLDAFL